jgi:hypothetical protein
VPLIYKLEGKMDSASWSSAVSASINKKYLCPINFLIFSRSR